MKKSELKSKAKAETKTIEKEIEINLVDGLKTVTANLGKGSEKLAKKISKGSKKLAKKIAKEVTPDQPANTENAKSAAVKSEKAKPDTKVKPVSDNSNAQLKMKKNAAK